MDKEQAEELLAIIELERAVGPAHIYRIANGEHVIRLKARTYHIWGFQDYRAYIETKEAKQQAKREAAKEKELVAR